VLERVDSTEFSKDIVGEDGEVDRKRLGAKVFASVDRMAALNRIVSACH